MSFMPRNNTALTWALRPFLGLALLALTSAPGVAQTGLFDRGWTLQPAASSLSFQSIKNNSVVETSGFATYGGDITADGAATIRIMLESVDTKVDLRNVRMRFLLFETFQFPEAVVSVRLDPTVLADLPTVRRKTLPLPVTLDLHGVSKTLESEVTVTVLDENTISVASAAPVMVQTADFNLDGGIAKLEEAANVEIVPSASVTFDFLFRRNSTDTVVETVAAVQPEKSAALEPEGILDAEACKGRFEILSRTQSIFFRIGSARIDGQSEPFLNSLTDIVARCPGMKIEVSGHTDSDGAAKANQRLSEKRAQSVTTHLIDRGIAGERIASVGYGETQPAVPNDTQAGKRRNRRIEFAVVE